MASVNREMREYARERVAQVEARIERRLEAARREGWKLRLRHDDCREIAADLDAWRARGLPPSAAKRIERAAAIYLGTASPGARLSVEEVQAVRPAGKAAA